MAEFATYPAVWQGYQTGIIAATGTSAKILVDVTPAQVIAAVSGETALPGESGVRQRVLLGGCRVIDGWIASTDTADKVAVLWTGIQTSLYANMGTVATTATTNGTVTRTTGSFITDGLTVGDSVMAFGCTTAANNGNVAVVTGVVAGTLTVNGTTAWTAETQGAGFRLFKVSRWTERAVPLNSGNTNAIPPVALLGGSQDPSRASLPDAGLMLGANEALLVSLAAAASSIGSYPGVRIDFRAGVGLY